MPALLKGHLMLYNAKNGSLALDGTTMNYISFGNGDKNIILLPGVGDGLKTVKGMALPFAFLYRSLAKSFKVYVFSRRNNLPEKFSTEDMAADLKTAVDILGISKASVVGVSQGGMIAEHFAADYPDRVERLVLTVTLAEQNNTVRAVIGNWLEMARRGDYRGIMTDTSEKSYSEKYLRKARPMYSFLCCFTKPKSFGRFITMADSCLTHNAAEKLSIISCPTLVIGGKEDKIVTGDASVAISKVIPNSTLVMYDGLGHGLYEEATDFLDRIIEFCK